MLAPKQKMTPGRWLFLGVRFDARRQSPRDRRDAIFFNATPSTHSCGLSMLQMSAKKSRFWLGTSCAVALLAL